MASTMSFSSAWMPIAVRLLASSLLGSIAIGFISEYASYFFAWRHGARLPLEGVSFLSFTISVMSFGILLVTLLTVTILYGLVIQTIFISTKYGPVYNKDVCDPRSLSERHEVWRRLPWRHFLRSIAFEFTTLYFTIGGLSIIIAKYFNEGIVDWIIDSSYSQLFFSVQNLIIIIITLLVFLSLRVTNILSWIISISSIVVSLYLCAALFSNHYFGGFLRHTGFGGGNEVTIIRDCHGVSLCKPDRQSYLFLRTKDFFILYNPEKDSYEEVPEKDILRILSGVSTNWALAESESALENMRKLIDSSAQLLWVYR